MGLDRRRLGPARPGLRRLPALPEKAGAPGPRRRPVRKKSLYAVLGVAVLGIAGFLISQALSSSLVYFILPSEYARDTQSFDGRFVRLGGLVEPGSVRY